MGVENPKGEKEWSDIQQVPAGVSVNPLTKNEEGNFVPMRKKGGDKIVITKLGKKDAGGTEILVDDGIREEKRIISPCYNNGSKLTFRAIKA
jgi:hypothetical protein